MRIGSILFVVWAVLVALWWVTTSPESAPQQAALAGQALVLVTLPYCVLAALQRSQLVAAGADTDAAMHPATRQAAHPEAGLPDIDPDLLARPGGAATMASKMRGERGDEGAQV